MDADELKEEIAHCQALIKDYTKRLRVLERQAAKFGIHVPPQIQVEIDELAEKIQKLTKTVDDHKQLLVTLGERNVTEVIAVVADLLGISIEDLNKAVVDIKDKNRG